MKKYIFFIIFCCFSISLLGQQIETDSITIKELNEVIVVGAKNEISENQPKILATIDQFLDESPKIELIKRGAYAWEPIINGMATERTIITIDGMRIFGACTDKMDPITSYVEVSNLAEAELNSGQQGTSNGNTIGGSLDLKRKQNNFNSLGIKYALHSGFETNNSQKIIGTELNYSRSKFYINTNFMLRNADNYKAGNNEEVLFSQYKKLNTSFTTGFLINKNQFIEGSLIYDKATNVGYPALPMDVSLAEAVITSLKYHLHFENSIFKQWETKVYFNSITHIMDDTKRPFVPIHMDMPGWSDTYGFYSKIDGTFKNHHFKVNLNSFYNKSVAEMTMYPSNPNENLMFMYTWPDVRTLYNGISLEDNIAISKNSNLILNTNLGNHSNNVASDFGLASLQIFYPNLKAEKNEFLKSFASTYQNHKSSILWNVHLGYGERAPSVSEGYGFYLFNSFDGFDYIGNPNLKNEKSFETGIGLETIKDKWKAKFSSNYFYIKNYIIGQPLENVAPMTIGANGVKSYSAFDYATIFTNEFTFSYKIQANWQIENKLKYSLGKDDQNKGLPFMSPFSYKSYLQFAKNKLKTSISINGNATQTEYNSFYGEDKTPDYIVFNWAGSYKFNISNQSLLLNLGVENIFDHYYSTFSDWNNIPRMGRNFYINLVFRN